MFSKKAKMGRKTHGFIMNSLKRVLKVSEKSIDTKHGKLYFLHHENPDKETLVLIHGFSDIPDSFLTSLFSLRKKYNIILPALKGFDQDGVQRDREYSLGVYSNTIIHLLDSLGIESFHIGGNSLGGATSLQIYKDYRKRVKSLILINCAGFEYPHIDSVIKRFQIGENPFVIKNQGDFTNFKNLIFHKNRRYPLFIENYIYEDYKNKSQDYTDISQILFENDPDLSKGHHVIEPEEILIPTLFIWGKSDGFFPLEIAKEAHKKVKDSRLEVIETAGHVPHHEAPHKVQKLILNFLNQI